MSWVTIIWAMVASACLTLAAMHLLVWARNRTARASLFFALTAGGTAGLAFCELWMMRAKTIEEFGRAIWWLHLPTWIIIVSLVGFVRLHLRAGRPWLAWTVCGLRTLCLLLNFLSSPNINFREITSLPQIHFLGETVAVAQGVTNPWTLVAQASLLALLVFVVDATVTVWRRRGSSRLRWLSAAIVLFVLAGNGEAMLIMWLAVQTPITASLFYVGIVAAMGMEMSDEVLRAARLSNDLRESEARLSAQFANSPDAILVIDRKHRILSLNRTMTGRYTVDELIGMDCVATLAPEFRKEARRKLNACFETGERQEIEHRLWDGIWVYGRIVRLADGNDSGRLMIIATDITKRKVAEENLRQSEEFNRTVLASVLSHSAILDRAGTIIRVNDSWLDLARKLSSTGDDADLLPNVGASFPEVCQRAAAAGNEPALRLLDGVTSVLEGKKESFDMEISFDLPTESRWFVARIMPLKTPDGGAVVSYSNITLRKKAEQEVERQRQELAHLSRVTMLGELSGSLAHELNQPLMAILSNAQAAQRFLARPEPDRTELAEILDDIVAADQHAGEVIRRLRFLFKKGEAHFESVDANEVVSEVLKLVRSDLVHRSVAIQTELAPDLPKVRGDRVQLQQVLLNLVTNASDAMAEHDESERRLWVRTARADHTGVRVTVRDSGRGIPADALERIFEPFFTTKAQGLGLGLGVCRTILDAHGGDLCAENNAEGGASFHFTLAGERVEGRGSGEGASR